MVVPAPALSRGTGGGIHVPDPGIRDDPVGDRSGRQSGASGSGCAGNGVCGDRDGAEGVKGRCQHNVLGRKGDLRVWIKEKQGARGTS